MTELIQGTLKRVFNKAIPEDQFGNTTRLSLCITPESGGDDVWVSCGTAKREGLSVRDGKDWLDVGVGSKIVVVAERNGEYLNARRSDVKVLSAQAPSKTQAVPRPTHNASSGGVDWAKKDAGIEAGHAVNCAVALLGPGGDPDRVAALARTIHAITRELQQDILNGNIKVPGEKPAPAAPAKKVAAKKAVKEEFEDDEEIPF